LAVLILLAVTDLVLHFPRERYLTVGWLWFLGTLVPMIGIVQVGHQSMADRYAYLPFIGLFIMICWGIADFAVSVASGSTSLRIAKLRVGITPRFAAALLIANSCAVLSAFALLTYRQLNYWSDNVKLWSHVSDVIGPNLISEQRTGDELLKRGQSAEAMQHYFRAVAIAPADADSNFALGVYEQKQGDFSAAIRRYKIVAEHASNPQMRARALSYMSYVYRRLGDYEDARASLSAAETVRR
jgi:hypothetical protein